MTDWDEVKRLAADFQKIQLSSTTQRLSERNCIEIVTWLLQRKMIDLIFTSDGKEYMTPGQLIADIRAELYVNGGRVNLVELAKTLGVDLNHINAHINDVLRGHKDITCVLGQLIDASYVTRIAGEINEKLAQQGQVNVSDLTMVYDLPAEFLQQQVLERHLGKLIFGKQDKSDGRVFFTESFVARTKAKIRGALSGLTRPTSINVVLSNVDVTEKLFFSLFEQSSTYGVLSSKTTGAQYIPNVYSRSQNEWVHNFYKQNGYLEYDALSRLGISDYKTYLKKQAAFSEVIYLNSCAVSKNILDRFEADIDECIASKTYLDLQGNLPSVFNENDMKMLIEKVLTPHKAKETLFLENFILSKPFLDNLAKDCDGILDEKVKQAVESGRYQQYQTDLKISSNKSMKSEEVEEKFDKRDERRKKAAGGKSGGGTQGRETKTKSTKKSNRKPIESDDHEIEKKPTFDVITPDDILNATQIVLESEGLEELIPALIQHLLPILNEKALQSAAHIYATTVADKTASLRETHNSIQNKLNNLLSDIRLFSKTVKLLPSDLQTHLYKYLLKTLCMDFINEILNYLAAEEDCNVKTGNFSNLNNDERLKFINRLKTEHKVVLTALLKTLSATNVDEFMECAENALGSCSMILKKVDKKKDRILVLNHKHALLEQLEQCEDPPLILHLATLIVFITVTQSMVHASGRHVAGLLSFLKASLPVDVAIEFTSYHDMVTMVLSGGSDVETAKERLVDKMGTIKEIAREFRKTTAEKS